MKQFALSWLALALAWVWSGSTAQAAITLKLTSSSSTVVLGGAVTLTATVTGTTNTALDWYVNGVVNGSSAQGTLTACTTVAPLTCTYTAPPVDVPSPNPAVIKVVSVADSAIYKTAKVTVTDTIAVTLSPASKTLALSGTQVFTATISNTGNTALSWYVNGVLNGNTTQGELTACTTVAPLTCTYTVPPLDVPIPNPAVIKVASVADPAKFKTAKVTVTDTNGVCESGHESILSGQYAFSLNGFNDDGFTAVVGSITVDGAGNITGGEADANGALGLQTASPISASSYSVGADNRGCAKIVTGFGTFNTRFDLGDISSGKAAQGRIMEFDPASSSAFVASGQILQQTTSDFSAGPSGNYVFINSGWDTSTKGRVACDGVHKASGGIFSNGEEYCNDNGTVPSAPTTGITGTFSSLDTYGRFTKTLGTSHLVAYMVSTALQLEISTDANPVVAGQAILQKLSTFSAKSVNGDFVLYENGQNDSTGGSIKFSIGHGDGIGTYTYDALYQNDGGTWTVNGTSFTCSFAVASNGRMSATGGTGCDGFVYLTAANTGVGVGHGAHVFSGYATPQTGRGSFSTASVNGTYFGGDTEIVNQSSSAEGDMVTLNDGSFSDIYDVSSAVAREADQLSTISAAVASNGTFIVSDYPGQVTGVAIDATHFVLADNITASYPTVVLYGPSSADTVAVTITNPTTSQTVPVKKTLGITAHVAGTSNTGLAWTVNGVSYGNSTYGTITGTYPSFTYTAPTTVPSPATFNITATSDADVSKSTSLSVTISAGVVIAITTPTSPQSLAISSTLGFTASVTGTSNTGVTWKVNSITNGNSTYGTITGSGLSVTYHAPAAVPSPATFNVTATSTEDNTKSASVSVTITSGGGALGVAITTPSNPASVAVGSALPLAAAVTGATADLTWTVNDVTNGNSTYGTITGSYPSYTYTPPPAIPGGSNPVTIVATQSGTSQSASLAVTINPSASAPTAINVTGGAASATGINFNLPSMTTTLGLADIGTCGPPANPTSECSASVTGIQVSRSGAATADCPNTTDSLPAACSLWLLGQGLTSSPLAVSVTHGSTTDVTVSSVETTDAPTGYTAINFLTTVSGSAPTGNRDIVVTIGSGATQETQVYVGAIQIVN